VFLLPTYYYYYPRFLAIIIYNADARIVSVMWNQNLIRALLLRTDRRTVFNLFLHDWHRVIFSVRFNDDDDDNDTIVVTFCSCKPLSRVYRRWLSSGFFPPQTKVDEKQKNLTDNTAYSVLVSSPQQLRGRSPRRSFSFSFRTRKRYVPETTVE